MSEKQYDEFQQKVIDINNGYNLVLAPPGCGKTDILAERIVKAHQDGVAYSDMMCLTFTNRAAKGMRERIAKRTNNPVPDDLFVGNLHRFCSQYLFKQKVIPQNAGIIDENDSYSILQTIIYPTDDKDLDFDNLSYDEKSLFAELANLQHILHQIQNKYPIQTWLYYDKWGSTLASFFNRVLADKLDLSEKSLTSQHNLDIIAAYLEDLSNTYDLTKLQDYQIQDPTLLKILNAFLYKQNKERDDLLDFDDLLLKTYDHLLKNTETNHKYKWIQIDEVQDLNRLQFAIADLLTDKDANVVYLGDEQQAIFSFMGAKVQTIEWLKERCGNNIYHLYKNYRSPKYLLDVFNTFAINQLEIDPSLLPSTDNIVPRERIDLYCARAKTYNENAKTVAYLANKYNEFDGGTVAVLVTSNNDADKISIELDNQGIKHFKVSGNDVFSSKDMQAVIAHLTIIHNELSFTSWARLLFRLGIVKRYNKARDFMRALKDRALLPTDFINYNDSTYVQECTKAIKYREIVLFDTETTGLDIFNDDIVQIAAMKIRNGVKVEGSDKVVYMEMNEGKSLPKEVGGKENTMIAAMEKARQQGLVVNRKQGLREFMDYCKGAVLFAHNVRFDYNILKYNLLRDLPEVNLNETNPLYYDTLKLIRLLEPRLRVYKLENLIQVLDLKGTNSHNAIDDVDATYELLKYCEKEAENVIPKQIEFMHLTAIQKIAKDLCDKYKDLYINGLELLYNKQTIDDNYPLVVQEMINGYNHFVNLNAIFQIPKWEHIIRYFSEDLIDTEQHPYMIQQLDAYITDINTTKEADMCGGKSMTEKIFVSTVHKAKGLEFDNVIVTDCVDGVYPFYKAMTSNEKAEDARKFYVAISRAKKRLCLLWYEEKNGWTKTVTPFIGSIKGYFDGPTG